MFGFFLFSCNTSKHTYAVKNKELEEYAKIAREPGFESFVIHERGNKQVDTIRGEELRIKKNKWYMDDKEIFLGKVISYQDRETYAEGAYVRLLRGKISLFMARTDDSYLVTTYNKSAGTFNTDMKGGVHSNFKISVNDTLQGISYFDLDRIFKDCPAAVKQAHEEFDKTTYANTKLNHHIMDIADYRALIRILNLYNNCN